jgi:hypothetical protein
VEQQRVRPGDPTVQDIAHDRDVLARKVAEVAPHGERIEQRLRRMLVHAVAGVDDGALRPFQVRQPVGGSAGVVPDHDRVGAHGLQCQRRVLEALALGHAGALGGEVDDVGTEPLGRRLERDAGPGGVLEEQVDDGPAPQCGQLLDRALRDRQQLVSGVEDPESVIATQVASAQQMPHAAPTIVTPSTPSISASRT